jgi:hypothetical protein
MQLRPYDGAVWHIPKVAFPSAGDEWYVRTGWMGNTRQIGPASRQPWVMPWNIGRNAESAGSGNIWRNMMFFPVIGNYSVRFRFFATGGNEAIRGNFSLTVGLMRNMVAEL